MPRLAGTLHTTVVLVALAALAVLGKIRADRMSLDGVQPHIRLYLTTIVVEWLLFAFVVWGVRRHGVPLQHVVGPRWLSVRQALRDIVIAVGFWVAATIVLAILAWSLSNVTSDYVRAILPVGRVEFGWWLALSITAGICEETIFRGYLQGQFTAFANSAPAGILVSAVAFGFAHVSQGLRTAALLTLYGAMLSVLAHWRRTVRPGMITHSLNGIIAGALKT